jgi:hypothetical protein
MSATSQSELRDLCAYVAKTVEKDIDQVKRHAREISHVWEESGTDRFVEYLTSLSKIAGSVYVVLSWNQRDLLEELRDGAFESGLNPGHFSSTSSGHFELLDPGFLRRQLEALL